MTLVFVMSFGDLIPREKLVGQTSLKLSFSALGKIVLRKQKYKVYTERKDLQNAYLIEDLYLKHISTPKTQQ
jgi:hypothetical protein